MEHYWYILYSQFISSITQFDPYCYVSITPELQEVLIYEYPHSLWSNSVAFVLAIVPKPVIMFFDGGERQITSVSDGD